MKRTPLSPIAACFLALLLPLFLIVPLTAAEPAVAADDQAEIDNTRRPTDDSSLRYWLQNMVWSHRFTSEEIAAATGMSADEIAAAMKRLDVHPHNRPPRGADAGLLVLPYPGGRHPRIGFLEGAIRPQRETKVSVFTPWDESAYLVIDVPEAIWWAIPDGRELLYLAHTHIDTTWDRRGVELEKLEWRRRQDGTFVMERRLPNDVVFGTKLTPGQDALRMKMWLTNGADRTLTELRVQNCIMLKGAPEFADLTNDNKLFREPYAACKSSQGNRWLITAWEPCRAAWGNTKCPCIHSDPQFPDCRPGETVRLTGWLSFYEGDDVDAEIDRIDEIRSQEAAGR